MGKRARRKQREAGERKQPNEAKRPFVEAKVAELHEMDNVILALLDKGGK